MAVPAPVPLRNATVPAADRRRIVGRIMRDHGKSRAEATQIFAAAVLFLRLCATFRGRERFSPSPAVDIGWHIFLLYTRAYAAFCAGLGGFINHEPNDVPGRKQRGGLGRTLRFMRSHGISFNATLWPTARRAGICDAGGCSEISTCLDCSDVADCEACADGCA